MRCPTLAELPPPPPGKRGWPWTEESPPLPETLPDGQSWPRISIVTPSYNQGQFIEETIRSVLLQGYPDLEYIIIDGGSTDESVEIIRKYEPWLSYWVSESDRGQVDAIQKGFCRSTGEIWAWLNSDDFYQPGATANAVQHLVQNNDVDLVFSDCYFVDQDDNRLNLYASKDFDWGGQLLRGNSIPQPTVFMRRSAYELAGGLNEGYRFVLDYEFWFRFRRVANMQRIAGVWANYRLWSNSHTIARSSKFVEEKVRVFEALRLDMNLPEDIRLLVNRALATTHLRLAQLEERSMHRKSIEHIFAAQSALPGQFWEADMRVRFRRIVLRLASSMFSSGYHKDMLRLLWKTLLHDPMLVVQLSGRGLARAVESSQ